MNQKASIALLIPAYQPTAILLERIDELINQLAMVSIDPIIFVVNDGSTSEESREILKTISQYPEICVLHHAINLGKGAALKTGFNAILTNCPTVSAVVTADADGQHLAPDIVNLMCAAAQDPNTLYFGARSFNTKVPMRSRFGNWATSKVTRLFTGMSLKDTQTGLRAIPRKLCETALRIPLNGYDFELECVIAFRQACDGRLLLREIPIQTVYLDSNRGSHFDPVFDSMRIYYVFLRYCVGSLLTFISGYAVFLLAYNQSSSIGFAILLARALATFISFFVNRAAVFRAHGKIAPAFARFVVLVASMGFISYLATSFLNHSLNIPVALANFIIEGLLFFASFALNNIFVFGPQASSDSGHTDWDQYYSGPYRSASFTRKITLRLLLNLMQKFSAPNTEGKTFLELGGANSCFLQAIQKYLNPREYHIADNNKVGLDKTRTLFGDGGPVTLHEINLLDASVPVQADITFSVGLIEHFDPENTARLVNEHFRATNLNGLVIIAFPTATWLYRIIRGIAEWLGLWIFFDERPLKAEEVLATAKGKGAVLYNKINWAIGLTQRVIVFRNLFQQDRTNTSIV